MSCCSCAKARFWREAYIDGTQMAINHRGRKNGRQLIRPSQGQTRLLISDRNVIQRTSRNFIGKAAALKKP